MTATIIASGNSLRGFTGPFIGDRIFINHTWRYFHWWGADLAPAPEKAKGKNGWPDNYDRLICYDKIDHKVDQGFNSWPYYHTHRKNGGQFQLVRGGEFQTEYPKVGNWNTTVAFAINIAWHWGYRKLYLLGVDGYCGEYFHFYDEQPVDKRRRKNEERKLKGENGIGGMNGKILKAVLGFEENGGEVVFVESEIQEGITLKEYANDKGNNI